MIVGATSGILTTTARGTGCVRATGGGGGGGGGGGISARTNATYIFGEYDGKETFQFVLTIIAAAARAWNVSESGSIS
jgi:hypothetical protein